jgi:energy-coupling factor transport system ATP-binding protein
MTLALHVADLQLTYPRAPTPTLTGVSLDVRPGERVLVTGPSGSGKSTLALCWSGIVPHSIPARLSGRIELCGHDVAKTRVADLARDIAYVFQDADTQLCALSVEDEIAFALENRCMPAPEIDRRIAAAMSLLGLPAEMRRRDTLSLSGGEKQRVVLAAALAQDVPVYVFDEPTSQLDPEATATTYGVIDRLARKGDQRSLIYIDHKVEHLLALTDRVLLLGADGSPAALETPQTMFHDRAELVDSTGAWLPAAARLFRHLRQTGMALQTRPLTMSAALADLDELLASNPGMRQTLRAGIETWLDQAPMDIERGAPVVRLERVSFAPPGAGEIVSDVSIDLHGGEIVGLVGRNGAGKSTLGQIIAGLLRPKRGMRTVLAGEQLGAFLFQNPEHQFVSERVCDELFNSVLPLNGAASEAEKGAASRAVEDALRSFGLWEKRDAHPYQLSQGQKRRLSFLAATLAPARPVMVLDEPSYGLDAHAARLMREHIRAERSVSRVIVVISHDIDWLAGLCDRIAIMDRGRLVHVGNAGDTLRDAALLCRHGLAQPVAGAVASWLHARG